jgi:flagellar biosynthesis anti-sigma factor FlgM
MIRLFDGNNPAASRTSETAKPQETVKTGQGPSTRGAQRAGEDRVELSSAAGSLWTALETAAGSRAARVEALRATYQAGGYRADPAAISRGMVDEGLASGAPA